MKSEDYIKKVIDNLVIKYPFSKCRYENHWVSESHFIEITPMELINNYEFQDFQIKTISDFIDKFPFENLTFISDDDVTQIEMVTYEKTGKAYKGCEPTVYESLYHSGLTSEITSGISYINVRSGSLTLQTSITLNPNKNLDLLINFYQKTPFAQKQNPVDFWVSMDLQSFIASDSEEENKPNNQLPLAA